MKFKRGRGLSLLHIAGIIAVIVLIGWCLFGGGPTNQASHSQLPNSFYLDEHVVTWTTKLSVVSNDGDTGYGTVTKHALAIGTKFTYTDGEGKVAATAKKQLISWGTKIDIYDEHGNLLGTLKEKVFESLLKTWTTYQIVDANDNIIAESEKVQFGATKFTLKTPGGVEVVKLYRPWINVTGDNWYVDIKNQNVVDKRILIMIAAFKSSK